MLKKFDSEMDRSPMLVFFYILNTTILILHEIESGYEKEWEILKLPVRLTGFLLIHIPILFLFLYGFYSIMQYPETGGIIAILAGSTGLLPFLVHKVIVKRAGHFDRAISNSLIFGNVVSGVVLIVVGIVELVG